MTELDIAVEAYREYLSKNGTRWDFSNNILYDMCKNHLNHNDPDEIAGKILIIGRTYAASIERRKKDTDIDNDSFYYDKVVGKMITIGDELDKRIKALRESEKTIDDEISLVLQTHLMLTKAFNDISGLDKRSLASKYLHFHCPEKFFIYDSRSSSEIKKIVKKNRKQNFSRIYDTDTKYEDFVNRMLVFQKKLLETNSNEDVTPRKLDSFLLYGTGNLRI